MKLVHLNEACHVLLFTISRKKIKYLWFLLMRVGGGRIKKNKVQARRDLGPFRLWYLDNIMMPIPVILVTFFFQFMNRKRNAQIYFCLNSMPLYRFRNEKADWNCQDKLARQHVITRKLKLKTTQTFETDNIFWLIALPLNAGKYLVESLPLPKSWKNVHWHKWNAL